MGPSPNQVNCILACTTLSSCVTCVFSICKCQCLVFFDGEPFIQCELYCASLNCIPWVCFSTLLLGVLTQIHIFIYSIISIPIMTEKEDKEMEEAIKKVDGNPAYKVLTKEEYEILMGGVKPKVTSTPRVPLPSKTPKTLFTPGHLVLHQSSDYSSFFKPLQ